MNELTGYKYVTVFIVIIDEFWRLWITNPDNGATTAPEPIRVNITSHVRALNCN